MNPENLGIEPKDLEVLQRDKFTQISPKDLCPYIEKIDKSSVTVFEFCHILKDSDHPDNITIIRETVSEEASSHSPNKYRSEVLSPYLKHRPEDLDFEEDVLELVLKSAGLGTLYPGISIEENTEPSNTSSFAKADALTSYSSMDHEKYKEYIPKSEEPECPLSNRSIHGLNSLTDEPDYTPVIESDNAPKTKFVTMVSSEEIIKCKCQKKMSGDSIRNNNFTRDFEPTTVRAAPNDDESQYSDEQSHISEIEINAQNTFSEAHSETISTMRGAMENFMEKFYKTTQDAVTLITTESAKRLIKTKTADFFNNTEVNETDNDNKSSETPNKFSILGRAEYRDSEDVKESFGPGSKAIVHLLTKVDSATNFVCEHISKGIDNLSDGIISKTYNNSSSPYDKPKPPSDVTHTFLPEPEPTSNSVFSVIKSKIFSMFGEPEAKSEETLSSKSSATSSSSSPDEEDSDDRDLIEKQVD